MVSSIIIDLCKEKQEKGYKALYESCISYVYAIVKSYISDKSSHQDMVQEIFARVFLSLHTFDENKGAFKFWLRKICVNQCLMSLRKMDFLSMVIPIDALIEQPDRHLEPVTYQLTRKDIEHLLEDMPSGYRTIFLLIAIDEYSHEEVSQLLDISAETSRSQYSRARKWIHRHVFNQNNSYVYGI